MIQINCTQLQSVVTAAPDSAQPYQRRSSIMRERIKALEDAILHLEGAHYALHDIVARILAKAPAEEVETIATSLADQVSVHAEKIGAIRLAGYTEEVRSVAEEAKHNRAAGRELVARMARGR